MEWGKKLLFFLIKYRFRGAPFTFDKELFIRDLLNLKENK